MWLHIVLLFLFLSTLLDSIQSQDQTNLDSYDWTHHTVLDADGKYHLSWKPPEDRRSDSKICFKVVLKTKGYFGLGFSPNGGMSGSDIVTGWIKNGQIYFEDRHAVSFSLPPRDASQDYELISAYENDNCTVFVFCRKLNTCDQDDMAISDDTMRVIFAFSYEDPTGDDPVYHLENRGTKSIMLLQNKVNKGQDALNLNSSLIWDIISPGVNISSFHTLYWCKLFKSPQVSDKHHIIHVQPVIQKGHEQFVHHILLYECVGVIPPEYEEYLDHRGHQCYDPNMPISKQKCQGVTIAWGIGGEDLVFPEHVGLPIEPAPGKYYLLEMHYDNPQLRTGIVDNSGLRVYYTPKRRNFDAGIFAVGASVSPWVFVPPDQKGYVVVGHSTPECITSAFPDTGVKALGIILHSHLLGKRIKCRHFRGNEELAPLADDRNYDFNYQEYRLFTKEVEILPGDHITAECTYDSTNRRIVTFGGLSTKEEMCMCFILYYPFVNRYISLSAPQMDKINEVLKTNARNETEVVRSLMSFNWTNTDVAKVENVMRYSDHVTQCFFGRYPEGGVKRLASYPRDLIPYVVEPSCKLNQ